MRLISHKARQFEVGRSGQHVQHFTQRRAGLHAAAMQAYINLQINAQTEFLPTRHLLHLQNARWRVD